MGKRANTTQQDEHRDNPSPARRNKTTRYVLWLLGLASLFLIVYGIFFFRITSQKPLANFFSILEEQGYTPNVGFSGNYIPGNIIQIMERGADGKERRLTPPLVLLWKEQCFPGLESRKALYVLPESSGKKGAELNLGAEVIGTMLPVLQVDSAAAASYSMKLENTRVFSFARLDLSQNFSEQCVRTLEDDLRLGNKAEWYAVILEAIVVDAISFEINWRDNSTAAARNKVKDNAEKTLAALVKQKSGTGQAVQGDVRLDIDSEKTTVINAAGEVIVGYRVRQLEPVFSE